MKKISFYFMSVLLTACFTSLVAAQANVECKIGKTVFVCPDGFDKLPDIDTTTRLFRYTSKTNKLLFFIGVPLGRLDEARLKKVIAKNYSQPADGEFLWKYTTHPFVMDINTKYSKIVSSSLGLSDKYLLEIKTFVFTVNKKTIVLGYASDVGSNVETNRRLFAQGKSFSDQAVGCNAVVTALNSVTKEFTEKNQYCSFSGFSAPR